MPAADPPAAATAFAGLTKRMTFLVLVVPALVMLLAGTRTWATGRSADPILGGATIEVAGSQAAPGVIALAAVALAGTVALLTGGPRLRRVSAVIIALAAVGATILTLLVILDPAGALGTAAAERVGRTGRVTTVASLTFWAWPALVAGVLLTVLGVLAVPASGRWEGLSSRFDRPEPQGADPRGARRSAWDDLSDGQDPTLEPGADEPDGRDGPERDEPRPEDPPDKADTDGTEPPER